MRSTELSPCSGINDGGASEREEVRSRSVCQWVSYRDCSAVRRVQLHAVADMMERERERGGEEKAHDVDGSADKGGGGAVEVANC